MKTVFSITWVQILYQRGLYNIGLTTKFRLIGVKLLKKTSGHTVILEYFNIKE